MSTMEPNTVQQSDQVLFKWLLTSLGWGQGREAVVVKEAPVRRTATENHLKSSPVKRMVESDDPDIACPSQAVLTTAIVSASRAQCLLLTPTLVLRSFLKPKFELEFPRPVNKIVPIGIVKGAELNQPSYFMNAAQCIPYKLSC